MPSIPFGTEAGEREGEEAELGQDGGQEVVEVFPDQSIRFVPGFTQREADFVRNAADELDEEKTCGDCSHYIEGGGCHVVRGRIHPGDKCFRFFADIGVFADNEVDAGVRDAVRISMILWGKKFDWTREEVETLLEELREQVQAKRES